MKYILCPNCGEKLTIDTYSQLLSSPPQYPLWCSNCGYNSGIDCEEYLKLEGEIRMKKSTIDMENAYAYRKPENFNANTMNIINNIANNLTCPNCNTPLERMCYCTNPPQYEEKCPKCGYIKPNTTPNKIYGINSNKLKMRIKYFEGATRLQKIKKGNWIDVYANKDVFVSVGERAMIPLGFALELPQGWEAHLAPRSSTFKTWGIIQTNSVGVVDDTYIGDNDQWHMPVYCLQGKNHMITQNPYDPYDEDSIEGTIKKGTWIRKGDKIGQFRIMEVMPEIEFEEVESFGNVDRGGFGTTSSR